MHRFSRSFGALLLACSALAVAQEPLALEHERRSDGGFRIRLAGESQDLAARGLWRWRSDGGPWLERVSEEREILLPAPAEWIEVELLVESEWGHQRTRRLIWSETPRLPSRRDEVRSIATKRLGSIEGRALYRDRKYDLSGYTGMRRLPIRLQQLELRRASDDSLLARGRSDAAGHFSFPVGTTTVEDLRIDLMSTIDEPGLSIRVRDQADAELRTTLVELSAVDPDSSLQLGSILLLDAEQANLLDCALDVVDFLADPQQRGALPDSGSVPLIRFDGASPSSLTLFDGSEILVSSAASGDSDAWSDPLILAAFGHWALRSYGALDQWGALGALDLEQDLRRAFGDGAGMAFAALVRQHRGSTRLDADSLPVDADVHAFVDLPTAPPLGFAVAGEWALDLESRTLDGKPVTPRGQLGAFNVACMLHDMADDPGASDGIPGDDDPLSGGSSQWFQAVVVDLASQAGIEWIRFELAHDAWAGRYGDSSELASIAVATGRSSLFDDAQEPDGDVANAATLPVWIQPELSPSAALRLNELQLGAVDAVELFNPSDQPLDASGYRIVTYRNGFAQTSSRATVLPAGTVIGPGRCLVVHEGGGPAPTITDLYDAAWSVPWSHDEDGACVLENDAGQAIDFVRWSGSGASDPSSTPVPPGTAFSGTLIAPQLEPLTLSRDEFGTDLDSASDFTIRQPTPRVPNVAANELRSIRPRSESDWFEFAGAGSPALVQLHAFAPRDAAIPRLAQVDSSGAELSAGLRIGSEAWLELAIEPSAHRFARLTQEAVARSSAAWELFAWQPRSDFTLLPVGGVVARAQRTDPDLDDVLVQWSNAGSYGALRVDLDGTVITEIPGTSTNVSIQLPAGHHVVGITPILGAVAGPRRSTGVYVGATPCEAALYFESIPDIERFTYDGFSATGDGHLSNRALRDGELRDPYPNGDFSTGTLIDPIDLTSDARLEFVHHCHVLDDGDYAAVEISLDDGASWIELARYDAGDHTGGADPANWTDGVLDPDDWVAESISLAAYAGERTSLRFVRSSNASGNSIGWGIDDLRFGTRHGEMWIDPAGSDVFGCGHRERPFLSAGPALAAVASGDTIHLAVGLHRTATQWMVDGQMESVLMPLRPGVIVAGGDSVILDGSDGVAFGLFADGASGDSLFVSGLVVRGAEVGLRSDAAFVEARAVDFREFDRGIDMRGGRVELSDGALAEGNVAAAVRGGELWLDRCTVAQVEIGLEASLAAQYMGATHSIFALANGPLLRAVEPAAPTTSLVCNDFWGSPTPFENVFNWIGWVGNVWLEVPFCAPLSGDFRLVADAPQLDLAGCGRVGAFGVGCVAPVAVAEPGGAPASWLRSAPNPFNPRTVIEFQLSNGARCELKVYDSRGRLVRTLLAENLEAGRHRSVWDGRDERGDEVASGVYRLQLRADAIRLNRPLVLLR